MRFDEAYVHLTRELETRLPQYLQYHQADHTAFVVKQAEYLALAEGLSGRELELVKTAALYHDAGYLFKTTGHEEVSCEIARNQLPEFGYTPEDIDYVCRAILSTKLTARPEDLPGKILRDADLWYLGTARYTEMAHKLFLELKHDGLVKNHSDWLVKQVEFLSGHRYLTATAIHELEGHKSVVLAQLKAQLEAGISKSIKVSSLTLLQDIILTLAGVVLAGYALKGYLVPNHFFDGGVTGISLLVHEIYHLNLAVVIVLLNLPFVVVSYFTVNPVFAGRTLASIVLLGICLLIIPDMALTSDKLLVSVFGGVFLGMGIGLIMRAGAALDGIEVLALYTLKRTSFTISEIIMGINILIFAIAAFKFGIESALYSILTYFAATRCIDYVVEGIQAYTGVTIISGKSEMIKYELVNNLGRGITVYKGERGFLPGKYEVSADCDIIFTVITRLEYRKLKNLVSGIDPKAFVFASTIREASGGVLRRLHHHDI